MSGATSVTHTSKSSRATREVSQHEKKELHNKELAAQEDNNNNLRKRRWEVSAMMMNS